MSLLEATAAHVFLIVRILTGVLETQSCSCAD